MFCFNKKTGITIKSSLVATFMLLLTACNGFFEKDNTPEPKPLTYLTPEIKPTRLWSTHAGSGIGNEYLKLGPAIGETAIFTASADGTVTAVNKTTGNRNWQTNARLQITTTPGIGDGIVVVGSRKGQVVALLQTTGKELWRTAIPGEILAKPAIKDGKVIIKAIDGFVRALSVKDGQSLWSFQQVEPNLILRGSSSPIIRDRSLIIGFANGNLAKFSLQDGQLFWLQPVAVPEGAFAIQRMIDVDADPILFDGHLYAATYQGKITSFNWASGSVRWSHDISSYTGMIADQNSVYISDTKGYVWAFNADNGNVSWRQTDLEARITTGPAVIQNYVVVGDAEGYLHWLNNRDGHFVAREYIGGAMYAAPVAENNIIYALTNSGSLIAYKLS